MSDLDQDLGAFKKMKVQVSVTRRLPTELWIRGLKCRGQGAKIWLYGSRICVNASRLNCPPAISSHDSASFPPQPQVENHLSEAQASFVGLDCWGIPLFPSHVAYDLGRIRGHEPRACYG